MLTFGLVPSDTWEELRGSNSQLSADLASLFTLNGTAQTYQRRSSLWLPVTSLKILINVTQVRAVWLDFELEVSWWLKESRGVSWGWDSQHKVQITSLLTLSVISVCHCVSVTQICLSLVCLGCNISLQPKWCPKKHYKEGFNPRNLTWQVLLFPELWGIQRLCQRFGL